ncbi:MAG: bifunctional tRNA (5-methylaminomethyl-2-thiouridine)(34)-methyltransferase MnmD/FAD-dependent 5-carboxymethylaminomethyl-2-thiouridine(34) oxidoreductase MnmC [Betaproteobacteria bacterium]|nr:MAG: bifunctional tRNA (5-methylaminomethyl-2-thiouridine)(34)-methyltransferase MnmD/FAD-dependent 5-carboxymethylaminomethyl-2-thiouridine(34) oxidoreductase MnmC [Betaproteobacteria bacterium]
MKTAPIVPARIAFDEAGTPFAPDFGDVYHPRAGAHLQAQHVFLRGNELPRRWQGRERFVILETGFGLGNNFLATWAAWRADAQRCRRLVFLSIEKHPPRRDDLARAHAASPEPALARQLVDAWPPLTPNLHTLEFDNGAVQLLLAFGDVQAWLPELVAEVDAFFLDGFAPAKNAAMWDRRVLKALGRLAAAGATAATWSVAREVRDGLGEAGFVIERADGFAAKREMSVARFAPRFMPRRLPARPDPPPSDRRAIVVGAGLAGASAAWALAAQGFECCVLDRHAAPAAETSGNPAGLFHGTVNAQDGPHARAHRAAALEAARVLRPWLAGNEQAGRIDGLLRVESSRDALPAMRATLDALGLPADYVQAVGADEGAALAGVPLEVAAWHYPAGGWVAPAALVRHWMSQAGLRFSAEVVVQSLRRAGALWQALDAQGRVLAEAPTVVLANAFDALRLLEDPAWPLHRVRGQLSVVPAGTPGLRAPRLPLAGAGYALTLPDASVLCGATLSERDDEPSLRAADHAHNLAQLERLTGSRPLVDAAALDGRVGWRVLATDRLPLIGAVPMSTFPDGLRIDQPRLVPRQAGLYVFTALGSRGIAWAPLGARLLAGWIAGAPLPLESSLVDALDPARFVARAARHAAP